MHKTKQHRGKAKVGIRELRKNLSGYIKRAHDGQIIQVTSRNEVVAELRPTIPLFKQNRRKPGALKGRINISPDFDTLPVEMLEAFEG